MASPAIDSGNDASTTRSAGFKAKAALLWKWLFPGLRLDEQHALTRAELLDLLKTAFAAITFVSVLIAGLTFWLQERAMEKEYEWRHMKEAQDILKTWDERTSRHKAAVESYFRRRYRSDRMRRISPEDAAAIRLARNPADGPDAQPGAPAPELWDLHIKITELLNYFEMVSTACLHDIADEGIIREALGGAMMDWWDYLHHYVEVTNREYGREVWKPYRELMARWRAPLTASAAARAGWTPAARNSGRNPLHDPRSLDRR